MTRSTWSAIVAILALALPAGAAAAPLTLEDALARARGEQPSVRVARAQVEQAAAQVEQIDAGGRPTLSLGAGLDVQATRPPGLLEPSTGASLDLTGRWNLWDFGQRAARRRAGVASLAAIRWSATGTMRDVERQVTDAYWNALASKRLIEVAAVAVAAEERHLDQAERLIAADARAPIELAQIRSTLAQARLALVTADNDHAQARVALEEAMGVVMEDGWDVADGWPAAVAGEDDELATLLSRVERASDELAAARARRAAADATVAADATASRPSLDATVRAQTSTPGLSSVTGGWSAGVSLSWSLWDGGARRATLRRSRAERDAAAAEVAAVGLRLRSDVEAARLAVRGAKARQQAAAEAEAAAAAALGLAEARYRAGAGSAIELADAQDRVTAAATAQVQADQALARARTTLARLLASS